MAWYIITILTRLWCCYIMFVLVAMEWCKRGSFVWSQPSWISLDLTGHFVFRVWSFTFTTNVASTLGCILLNKCHLWRLFRHGYFYAPRLASPLPLSDPWQAPAPVQGQANGKVRAAGIHTLSYGAVANALVKAPTCVLEIIISVSAPVGPCADSLLL